MTLNMLQAQFVWNRVSEGKVNSCSRLGGLSSENFLIEASTGQKLVAKKVTSSYLKDFEHILSSYLYFQKNGIPALVPLLGKDHAYLQTVGDSSYVLFDFIDGFIYNQDTITNNALESAGLLLGLIHNLAFKDSNSSHQYLLELKQKRSQLFQMDFGNCAAKDLIEESIFLKSELKRKLYGRLSNSQDLVIAHGDYHNSNIIYGSDNKVAALLDLELTRVADAGQDYLKFIDLGCCNTRFDDNNFKMAKLFLSAYRSTRSLSFTKFKESLSIYLLAKSESTFFETAIAIDGKLELVPYLERDIKKLRFYTKDLDSFIEAIW